MALVEVSGIEVHNVAGHPHRNAVRLGALTRREQHRRLHLVLGVHDVQRRHKVKVNGVQIVRDGVSSAKWHGKRCEIPIEQLHVPLVAHGSCIEHDGCTLRVDHQVAVQPHTVVEQLLVKPHGILHPKRLVVRTKTVEIDAHGVHHPQNFATVHEELVHNHLVLDREGRIRLGHHQQVVAVGAVAHAVEFLRQHIQTSCKLHSGHHVVFLQSADQICHGQVFKFSVALEDGDFLGLKRRASTDA